LCELLFPVCIVLEPGLTL